MNTDNNNGFWKQIGIIIIGTTISILLTIGSSQLLEMRQRAKDRRLTAMMVLSNIESSARQFDNMSKQLAHIDTLGTWLLSHPVEQLELLPDDVLKMVMNSAIELTFITHDESAEKIFSNNIDTWKNMENFAFIDNVGKTFSNINTGEKYWNDWAQGLENTIDEIKAHPEAYRGKNNMINCLRDEKFRNYLSQIHLFRGWMSYAADGIRYNNRRNMACIGISEDEVMAFTNEREKEIELKETIAGSMGDYIPSELNPDSLTTLKELDDLLNNIAGN